MYTTMHTIQCPPLDPFSVVIYPLHLPIQPRLHHAYNIYTARHRRLGYVQKNTAVLLLSSSFFFFFFFFTPPWTSDRHDPFKRIPLSGRLRNRPGRILYSHTYNVRQSHGLLSCGVFKFFQYNCQLITMRVHCIRRRAAKFN